MGNLVKGRRSLSGQVIPSPKPKSFNSEKRLELSLNGLRTSLLLVRKGPRIGEKWVSLQCNEESLFPCLELKSLLFSRLEILELACPSKNIIIHSAFAKIPRWMEEILHRVICPTPPILQKS